MDDYTSDATAATRIRCVERLGELRTLPARRGRASLAAPTLPGIPLRALLRRSVPSSRRAR
jgi:hypothetical protein